MVVVLLFAGGSAVASCSKGCELYQGVCVCDIQPETAPPVKPSNEKPPKDKMPSYEREGVTLYNASSLETEDAKMDQEKKDATNQGKSSAGIK